MAAENFKVKKGLEVGTGITANSDGVNVTGIITATQFKGDGSGLTGVVGSGSGIVVKDEGSAVGTAGTVNFVGSGVAATLSAGTATVTINAGGLDNVVEDTTPQLGGNLDLNSKFVTGSGGINVTGVVTATTLKGAIEATTASFSGAIDANGDLDVDGHTELDNLNVAGVTTATTIIATTGLEPDTDNGAYLGTNAKSWSSLFVDNIGVDGNVIQALSGNLDLNSGSGSVVLKHGGNQKLTTTINGIEVPDLNVTGVGTVGRLDTSGVTLGTNNNTFAAKFIDDAVANFGTDNDLKISHDDTHARITNTKGNIVVSGIISATSDVKVGSAITMDPTSGIITATSFSGSGSGLTSIPSAQLSGALPALDGSALTGITASGSGIIVKHDGSTVGTAGTINFSTNLDVSAISAGIVTVTASGSSGVSLSGSTNNTVATVTGANALIGEANLTFDGSTLGIAAGSSDNKIQIDGSAPYIQFREGTTNKAYIQWSPSGYLQLANEEDGEKLRLDDGESGLIWRVGSNDRTVWTSGNDGASSGLDADLLDGQEGSYYTNAANLTGTIAAISGANLTTLNASELDSGEIPNGRFPATLPAVSGANLTALNASEITSGTLPIARIANDAVTFAKMQNVGTGVLIGRNDSGTGDIETLTAAEARTLLNVADGATAGITTAAWTVGHSGSSYYTFTGPGGLSNAQNADLHLIRGQTYQFIMNASGHGFGIQTVSGTWSSGNEYTTGITNAKASTGTITFRVPYSAPGRLYYACTSSHSAMVGNIYISGGGGVVTYEGAKELQLGNNTSSSVNSSNLVNLDLGGTHHDTAGGTGKLKLWKDASDEMSLGVSSNQMDFILTSLNYSYNFYGGGSGTTRLMQLKQNGIELALGNETGSGVTAPVSINLGGTYSSSAGNGNDLSAKLKLWTNGSDVMGLSVSGNQLDYIVTSENYDHVFYGGNAGTTELARFTGDGKVGIGEDDPDGNQLLIRGASTFQTNKGHIMLTGDSATVGQGPQIVFSESGGGSSYAGAYIGHVRQGSNSIGDLVFGTRGTSGDASTVPTERLRITSDGSTQIASGVLQRRYESTNTAGYRYYTKAERFIAPNGGSGLNFTITGMTQGWASIRFGGYTEGNRVNFRADIAGYNAGNSGVRIYDSNEITNQATAYAGGASCSITVTKNNASYVVNVTQSNPQGSAMAGFYYFESGGYNSVSTLTVS